jgi:hypothetical protein
MFGALVPIQLWFFDRLLEEKRERIRALAREVNQTSENTSKLTLANLSIHYGAHWF